MSYYLQRKEIPKHQPIGAINLRGIKNYNSLKKKRMKIIVENIVPVTADITFDQLKIFFSKKLF